MPQIPRTSPATGLPTPRSFVHTTSFAFVDTHGRTLLLRGVNLSGASKAPSGHLSHVLQDFWEAAGAEEDDDCWYEEGEESAIVDDEEEESGSGSDSERGSSRSGSRSGKGREKISFVGRPLRLDDGSADVHLARLRGWGFNLLRFPFTWESLEHEGPGKYDYEFMDYTIQVLCKCKEYGFKVYMDPHQDTWSRYSGGSGAPFWTLPACGINPRHITATQAAILHCEYPSPYTAAGPSPASLPAMLWSTNYGRLLSQTVFTLFFAGRDFAPNCIIDGVNIQDYLQSHYIEAVGRLVDRIRAHDDALVAAGKCARGEGLLDACVIGWDSMNEPFEGLCGWADLGVNPTKQGSTLKKGTYPTPAQSLRLGMGQPQTVEHWSFGAFGPSKDGVVEIDPKGRKVWADPVALPPDADTDASSPATTTTTAYTGGELPDGTHPRWGWKRDVSRWPLGTCVWAQHGVWDVSTGFVLRPAYFRTHPATGIEVEFLTDYWKPHWLAYAARVRRSHPEAIIFVQPPVFAIPPQFSEEELGGRTAYAPHYYDGLTLVTRHWNWFNADALGLLRGKYASPLRAVKLGEGAIRRSLHEQLGYLQNDVAAPSPSGGGGGGGVLGGAEGRGYPTVIGEIGTPFDMDGKRAYGWTDGGKHRGDYGNQEKALDASLQACDAWMLLKGKERDREREGGEERAGGGRGDSLNWTVWTYVPDDHSHEWGDGWNLEDLSLWSVDDVVREEEEEGGEDGECDCDCECDCDEDGDEEEDDAARGGEGGVYNEMRDMRAGDEETLHSRAVLLMHGEREREADAAEAEAETQTRGPGVQAQPHPCVCSKRNCSRSKSKSKSKPKSRTKLIKANSAFAQQQQLQQRGGGFQQQQPGRSLPMMAALSSLSLTTTTLGSSTSLGVGLGVGTGMYGMAQVQRLRVTNRRAQMQGAGEGMGIGGRGPGPRPGPGPGGQGRARSHSKASITSTASFDSADSSGSSLVQRRRHVHRHRQGCRHYNAQQQQQQAPMTALSSSTPRPRPGPTPTTSTATSSTIASTSISASTVATTTIPTPTTLARTGYSPNPYVFLTNGARAVRAFARPWPVAVVGRAVDVRFDVAKGVFRMVVWVGWEDRSPVRAGSVGTAGSVRGSSGSARGSVGEDAEDWDGEERERRMPTEVFLPLVHYAHPRLLEGVHGKDKNKVAKEKEKSASRTGLALADERGKGGYPPTASMASLVAHGVEGEGEGAAGRGVSMESSVTTLAPTPMPGLMHLLKPVLTKSSSSSGSSRDSDVEGEAEEAARPAPAPMSASSTGAATLVDVPPLASCSCSASASSGHNNGASTFTVISPISPISITTTTPAPTTTTNTTPPAPAPLLIENTTPASAQLIDVEVHVSGGRYAVRGQRLLWWYDVPKAGEARREYVLEVRRRGGALGPPPTKTKDKVKDRSRDKAGTEAEGGNGRGFSSASVLSLFAAAGVGKENGEEGGRRRERRKNRGCCESLCDEQGGLLGGCVIA